VGLDAGRLVRQSIAAVRHFVRDVRAVQRERQARNTAPTDTLILFYNTMWDQPLEAEDVPLPDGCRLTTDRARFYEAAAVVFHIPTLKDLPPEKVVGQVWVSWSLECDVHYPLLREPTIMQWFDLTMTYRQDADIVVTYTGVYMDGATFAQALRTPPRPKSADNLASLFISSGIDRSGRTDYATELMRHLDVHSYGKVLRNRAIPNDLGRTSKLCVVADHKFELAFENAIAEDYVTEKFFDPLMVGTVPVYLGAPNVEQFAPGDHCYINSADFSSPEALAAYLLHLQDHAPEYAAYLAWKERPFRPAFLALLARQEGHAFTRLGRAVQARRSLRP